MALILSFVIKTLLNFCIENRLRHIFGLIFFVILQTQTHFRTYIFLYDFLAVEKRLVERSYLPQEITKSLKIHILLLL